MENLEIVREAHEALKSEQAQTPPGKLKLWQVIVLAIVGLQLGPNIATVGGVLFLVIGYGSWLSIIIAFAMMVGVCEGIRLVSQANPSAKGLMSMVSASLGENSALYVRTSLMIGYVAGAASGVCGIVVFTSSLINDLGWSWGASTFAQIVIIVLASLASTAIAYRGVEASLKTSMMLGLACFPIIALLIGIGLTHTGLHLKAQFTVDETTISRAMLGAVLIIMSIIGIDGIASLADDTDQPARNRSRIVYGTFAILGVGLFVACITETPMMAASIAAIRQGLSPTAVLARAAGLPAFAIFVDLFMLLGMFAASVTVLTYGSRLLADAAEAKLLPDMFSQTHSRFASNHKSVILLGVAQGLVPIAGALFFRAAPLYSAVYISISAAYLWAIPHALICVGGIRVALRGKLPNLLSYLAMGASTAGFIGMLLMALSKPNADWQGLVSRISIAASSLLFTAFYVRARTKRLVRTT